MEERFEANPDEQRTGDKVDQARKQADYNQSAAQGKHGTRGIGPSEPFRDESLRLDSIHAQHHQAATRISSSVSCVLATSAS
jgi:hypothetical protein